MNSAAVWGIALPLATFVASVGLLIVALRKKWPVEAISSAMPDEEPVDEKSPVAQGVLRERIKDFVKKYLIVRRKEEKGFPFYEANRLSPLYRYKKSQLMIEKIYESNLIPFLGEKLNPKGLVLFGSIQKGTYHEKSDIDIFVQAKQKKINLSKFENKLKRKIVLFFEENPKTLTKGLLQNIYNGYVLSGKLEL